MYLLYLDIEREWNHSDQVDLLLFESEEEVKKKCNELNEWARNRFECRFVRHDEVVLKEIEESFPDGLGQSQSAIRSIVHSLEGCESFEFEYTRIPVYKKETE